MSSPKGPAPGGGVPVIVAVKHCSFTTAVLDTLTGMVAEVRVWILSS